MRENHAPSMFAIGSFCPPCGKNGQQDRCQFHRYTHPFAHVLQLKVDSPLGNAGRKRAGVSRRTRLDVRVTVGGWLSESPRKGESENSMATIIQSNNVNVSTGPVISLGSGDYFYEVAGVTVTTTNTGIFMGAIAGVGNFTAELHGNMFSAGYGIVASGAVDLDIASTGSLSGGVWGVSAANGPGTELHFRNRWLVERRSNRHRSPDRRRNDQDSCRRDRLGRQSGNGDRCVEYCLRSRGRNGLWRADRDLRSGRHSVDGKCDRERQRHQRGGRWVCKWQRRGEWQYFRKHLRPAGLFPDIERQHHGRQLRFCDRRHDGHLHQQRCEHFRVGPGQWRFYLGNNRRCRRVDERSRRFCRRRRQGRGEWWHSDPRHPCRLERGNGQCARRRRVRPAGRWCGHIGEHRLDFRRRRSGRLFRHHCERSAAYGQHRHDDRCRLFISWGRHRSEASVSSIREQ